jgi:hypothetical protein
MSRMGAGSLPPAPPPELLADGLLGGVVVPPAEGIPLDPEPPPPLELRPLPPELLELVLVELPEPPPPPELPEPEGALATEQLPPVAQSPD